MRAIVYQTGKARSRVLASASVAGFKAIGAHVELRDHEQYVEPEGDVTAFYGLSGNLKKIFYDYRECGLTTVFFDLGYFGRRECSRYNGYHRIAVNALHATQYFQRVRHCDDRLRKFGVHIVPLKRRRAGNYVLLCGQSAKAAWVYDLKPEEWETRAAETIVAHTRRPIYYRPKPSWLGATEIPHTHRVSTGSSIGSVISGAHMLVTHHSNAGIDAVIHGCPLYAIDGIASKLNAVDDLSQLESPRTFSDDERRQFLCDAAYVQWNVQEITDGNAWRHLINEGLL